MVVTKATLVRFTAIHFILPFILSTITVLHILYLHDTRYLLSVESYFRFYIYFTQKDFIIIIIISLLGGIFIYYTPNYLTHEYNYILATPTYTPTHIVPE